MKTNPKQEKENLRNLDELDFIFSRNQNSNTYSELFYTIINDNDFLDDDNNPRRYKDDNKVYAKKIITNKSTKFLVKIDNSNKLYNPLSSVSSIRSTKIPQSIALPENKFKQVSENVFSMYIHFLRSKNEAWLNNAERENF
jgi:hypothetical protein